MFYAIPSWVTGGKKWHSVCNLLITLATIQCPFFVPLAETVGNVTSSTRSYEISNIPEHTVLESVALHGKSTGRWIWWAMNDSESNCFPPFLVNPIHKTWHQRWRQNLNTFPLLCVSPLVRMCKFWHSLGWRRVSDHRPNCTCSKENEWRGSNVASSVSSPLDC